MAFLLFSGTGFKLQIKTINDIVKYNLGADITLELTSSQNYNDLILKTKENENYQIGLNEIGLRKMLNESNII